MATQGALSRARLLPTFFGTLLLVLGLVKLVAGVKLASLGGSYLYPFSGLGFATCGGLLLLALRSAVWLFSLCLAVCTVWALCEVGLDREQLQPRLLIWFMVGLLMLWPPLLRSLRPLRWPYSLGHLVIALVLAGICLDPLAQIRRLGPDYRGWAGSLWPLVEPLPLTAGAADNAAVRLPEG